MPAVCRTSDLVTGTCHNHSSPVNYTGTWNSGSSDVLSNELSVIRTGDLGATDCGHTFVALGGGENVVANDLKLQRVGDPVSVIGGGDGVSITGSPDVTSD